MKKKATAEIAEQLVPDIEWEDFGDVPALDYNELMDSIFDDYCPNFLKGKHRSEHP